MKNNKLVIIGNTSNAKLAHYYFENDSDYNVVAFSVDAKFIDDNVFCGLPVVDFTTLEKKYPASDYDVFVAIGYNSMNKVREKMYNLSKKKGVLFT